MESEKHTRARDWLTKSGYGLEMRVAAACRRHGVPTTQSVPYLDPTQVNTVREADVMVRFGNQLSPSGDCWTLTAVIECKSPTGKPWAALMVPDRVTGFGSTLVRSISAEEASFEEASLDRLLYTWRGFAPLGEALSADALVSVHEDQKATTTPLALRSDKR